MILLAAAGASHALTFGRKGVKTNIDEHTTATLSDFQVLSSYKRGRGVT